MAIFLETASKVMVMEFGPEIEASLEHLISPSFPLVGPLQTIVATKYLVLLQLRKERVSQLPCSSKLGAGMIVQQEPEYQSTNPVTRSSHTA